jgi:hypothetical protein
MTREPGDRTGPADPADAAAMLEALTATRADLAALPIPQVPPAVEARWAAALAAESATRRSATRRSAARPLLAAAALAAAVAAGVGALLPGPPDRPAPVELPALTVGRVDLVAVATAAVGTTDVGDLADPARRAGCLRAVAPAAVDEKLLGGRRVVLEGRPGLLLVLATGTRGGLRIVTVDPGCGPAGGSLLAQVVVG